VSPTTSVAPARAGEPAAEAAWSVRPCLDLDLERSPAERYAKLPEEGLEVSSRLIGVLAGGVPPGLRGYADRVREVTEDRFHQDAVARAARHARHRGAVDAPSGDALSWREVVLANVSYDLAVGVLGCSTLAAATADGPVLARNMDWWPADLLAQATFAFRGVRGARVEWVSAGWPGAIGVVTGMSSRGFAVSLNAVGSAEGLDPGGYPVLPHLRRVVEDADGFDHALELLRDTRLAASALFVLVGRDNHERVVVERTPSRHGLRWPEHADSPLLATNEYRALHARGGSMGAGQLLRATACRRYAGLYALGLGLEATLGYGDERFIAMLSHRDVFTDITAQQIVMRPRSGQFLVAVPTRLLAA
jgi:hypothetical protein